MNIHKNITSALDCGRRGVLGRQPLYRVRENNEERERQKI
jgi:hypothetical protein